ncbi:MAG: HAD-IA family hydrolase [Pseudomonadota bacterium]|nr:HAD-IA family hydrolase [Pseudomonadota bacterium]
MTNKRGRFTEPLLAALGLLRDFAIVVSGDTLRTRKPDPAPLLHAVEALGIDPGETLMVGDSVNDVLSARAARVPVICVRYGYHNGEDIVEARPDAIIDSLAELSHFV